MENKELNNENQKHLEQKDGIIRAPDEVEMSESVQSLIEEYDVESRYRILTGLPGKFIFAWLCGLSLFQLFTAGFMAFPVPIQRSIHLTFVIVAVYILYPMRRKMSKTHTPWYDWGLALLAGGVIGYIVAFTNEITRRGADPKNYEIWLGIAAIILVLEAGRRVVGNVLPCLSIVFLLYCKFGYLAPGMFTIRGYSLSRIVQHMYLTTEGIFGVALGVSATFVITFIIFGAFLSKSGGARLFNNLALALAGHLPGGPAKVAVIASGLLGTINGSSVANVATTGTFTIPLMKKVGYSPEYAGAVEACASTGGQLMPPIMGAGAFIMSEFLGIPYLTIAAAAILPAILYYAAVFVNVHIRAKKRNLQGLPKSELPSVKEVMKADGHLLLPVIVIIVTLLMKYTPNRAAFTGIVSILVFSQLRAHTRMGVKDFFAALEDGARGGLGVAMACAIVGFVVGTSSLTALGLTLSNNIIELAGGKLLPTLGLSMVACLVLGMGLPTTANYIVCSTIIAPALVKMGVFPLAAHLFVYYFGIMADLTPPVCLAAFTAAGISGGNPGQTGITATRIAISSYLLPYCFVYNTMLLLEGVVMWELAIIFISALLGIIALASTIDGWFYRMLNPVERLVLLPCALAAIHPDLILSVASTALIIVMIGYFRMTKRIDKKLAI